nr:hypothetical protein [Tanacetum cinerariifolium]
MEVEGVTRLKKYSELSAAEATQADCDVKATNIILQGLPPEVYALVSTHKVAKELWERIQMLMQGMSLTKQERELEYLSTSKLECSSTSKSKLSSYVSSYDESSSSDKSGCLEKSVPSSIKMIVSQKGPSKDLLNWYKDVNDQDEEEIDEDDNETNEQDDEIDKEAEDGKDDSDDEL